MPMLQVRLAYGDKHSDVVALVDSGAADSLFDRDVAEDLGIDLKSSSEQREYFGVAGQSVIGYIHRIQLQVQGFAEWIDMEAAFLDAKQPYQLLGQSGFFDNYEVTLRRYRGRFEVRSRTHLH
jgi:predicted aspartyl protease